MTKQLTAVIVDDEPLALEGLSLRLAKIPEIKVIGQAENGDEAIKLCQTLEPDVLFLDLQLPGLNGIEVVQAMQSDTLPMIVFVSAYSEYAIEAFELNAIDYVLKPANLGRLQKTVSRILERQNPHQAEKEKFKLLNALGETSGIEVSELEEWLETDAPLPTSINQEIVIKNSDNEKVLVPVKEIKWVDAAGDYMCVHTEKDTHVLRITMKKLESLLDEKQFARIHKSTIVNLNHVISIKPLRNNESIVTLNDDIELKVSRNYSPVLQNFIAEKPVIN
ncbi:LytR/AlgR family response regulator transcription factor [Pseudoalteromonas phenolica]|uniref:Response regulator n=1 Tax=Pseudoalteromonas phenolica TaxID=161398 RepID=A0A0S2K2V2_9GAMM|nr:LytTR family DNA-binding domain-containing protein [Pseudoalteromonas phenolica]ALO42609.1 Response regulator [Pseudoalteromonas phenolica]MBE0356286.1 two-component system, LytT family, response regulator [Pseudoalteromonas phenolica O-BC30]RXF00219.1 DNA-binding response regulator [Pseudoalteromonas phenolica O-BC30]TMO58190.1 DNA-binding response regulator [Pseudoalteromonas phenolica]